jgi:dUTPase
MIVNIKLANRTTLPVKGEPNAMCYDCYVHQILVRDDGKVEVDLGIAMTPPQGYGIRLIPRSSLTKYWWILNNSIGIGDEDYKDNYKAIFTPLVKPKAFGQGFYMEKFPYRLGERCCQLEIYKREDFEFNIVDILSGNDRGGGVGSTGK